MNKSNQLSLKLHNRFDFYLNGEHVAEAENLVVNGAYEQFNGYSYQALGRFNLELGNGSGIPAVTDTALFKRIHTLQLTNTQTHMSDTMMKIEGTRQFSTSELNGTYTEVGMSAQSLISHAMITDSSGSPIALVKTNTDVLTLTFILYFDLTQYFEEVKKQKIWDRPFITSNGWLGTLLDAHQNYGTDTAMSVLSEVYFPCPYVVGPVSGTDASAVSGRVSIGGRASWDNTKIAPRKRVYSLATRPNLEGTAYSVGILPIQNLLPGGFQLNGVQLEVGDGVKTLFKLPYTGAINPTVSLGGVPETSVEFIYEEDYDLYGAAAITGVTSSIRRTTSAVTYTGTQDTMVALHRAHATGSSSAARYRYLTTQINYSLEDGWNATEQRQATTISSGIDPGNSGTISADGKILLISAVVTRDYWSGVNTIIAPARAMYLKENVWIDVPVSTFNITITDIWSWIFHTSAKEVIISGTYEGVVGTYRFSYELIDDKINLTYIETMHAKRFMYSHLGGGTYSIGSMFILDGGSLWRYELSGFTKITDWYYTYIDEYRRIVFDGLNNSKLEYLNAAGEVEATYPITLPSDAVALNPAAFKCPFWLIPISQYSYVIYCCTESNEANNYYAFGFLTLNVVEDTFYMPYGWPEKNGGLYLKYNYAQPVTLNTFEIGGDKVCCVYNYVHSATWKLSKGKCYAKFSTPPTAEQPITADLTLPYFPKDEHFNFEVTASYKIVNPS